MEEGCAAHDANYRRVAHDLQVEQFRRQYRLADGQRNMRLYSQADANSHLRARAALQGLFPWEQLTHYPIVSSNGRPPVVSQTQTSDAVVLLAAATHGSVAVYSNGQHGGQPNTARFFGDATGNCPNRISWSAAALRPVLAQLPGSQLADMCAFRSSTHPPVACRHLAQDPFACPFASRHSCISTRLARVPCFWAG